jgi:hypothetical protein
MATKSTKITRKKYLRWESIRFLLSENKNIIESYWPYDKKLLTSNGIKIRRFHVSSEKEPKKILLKKTIALQRSICNIESF